MAQEKPATNAAKAVPKSSDWLVWGLIIGSVAILLVAHLAFARLAKSALGPQSVASGFGSVWVFTQGSLWRLNGQGATQARFHGQRNGLGKVVSQMAAFGSHRVFLRDADARSWRDCTAGESGVALACTPVFSGDFSGRNAAEGAIAVAPDGQRWVFVDFTAGELLLFDRDQRLIALGKGLRSPEGGSATWLGPQELGVIASDQAALHATEIAGDKFGPLQLRWNLAVNDQQSKGHIWSAAWGAERRSWYLAYSESRRAKRALWKADREGRRIEVISLGEGEPAEIANLDKETVLVPDVVRGQVHQVVSWANDRVSEFGDADFREALARGRERYSWFDPLQNLALGALIVVPLSLALLLAFRESQRRAKLQSEPADLPALEEDAEFWFTPDERQVALRHGLVLAGSLAVAAILIMQFRVFGGVFSAGPYLLGIVTSLLVLGVLLAGGLFWWRQRELGPPGLAVKGEEVLFDPGDGKIEQHLREAMLTDGRRLLVGKHLFWLRQEGFGIGPEWNAAELQAYLVKDLPRSTYRSVFRLQWLYFQRNPVVFWITFLPIVLALILLVALVLMGR